jgi:NAD(P)-dependent dehydrogenase (short-subunit alcohol dehydrogenase family)
MSGTPVLNERGALVVGATSGIGLATARTLAAAGCTVVLSGRTESLLQEHVTELQKHGFRASFLPLDITESNSVGRAAAGGLALANSAENTCSCRQRAAPALQQHDPLPSASSGATGGSAR